MVLKGFTCLAEVRGGWTFVSRWLTQEMHKRVGEVSLQVGAAVCGELGSCRPGLISHWFLMVNPAANCGPGLQILFFLSNLPAFSWIQFSDFAKFWSLSVLTEESTQLTALGEGKRANCLSSREGLDQELCGVPPRWELVEPWLGAQEWVILEMLWLDHEFELGKHCLQFTSRNEAEFTIWCLKTLMFAKCLSNPSHPIELKSLWLVSQ